MTILTNVHMDIDVENVGGRPPMFSWAPERRTSPLLLFTNAHEPISDQSSHGILHDKVVEAMEPGNGDMKVHR